MITPLVFSILSMHAKIHEKLDNLDRAYLRILEEIEAKEIEAFDDDARYQKLEDIKKELLSIKFTNLSP